MMVASLQYRKERLRTLLTNTATPLQFSDHQIGRGPEFYTKACESSLEGIISKRADAPYVPGDRGLWVKVKCQNREEFVVVGWTDPEGTRPWLGALLLAYYDPGGRLVYAGRAGTGSSRRSWNGCGAAPSRSPRPRCRSRCRRRAPAASDGPWCSAPCNGGGPRWSAKSQ